MLRTALLLLTLAAPALARPLTEAEQTSLEAQLDAFTTAMEARNWEEIGQTIPSRILELMASEGDITADQIRAGMVERMSHQMMMVTVEKVAFRPDGLEALDGEVDGSPVVQTSVPLDWAITWREQRIETTAPTLALFENGTWSLLRIEATEQRALVDRAYPFLEGVELPE